MKKNSLENWSCAAIDELQRKAKAEPWSGTRRPDVATPIYLGEGVSVALSLNK